MFERQPDRQNKRVGLKGLIVVLGCLMVILGGPGATIVAGPVPTPNATGLALYVHSVVMLGEIVSCFGSSFTPYGVVQVWLKWQGTLRASFNTRADDRGNVLCGFMLARYERPGAWKLIVRDESSGKSMESAFTVLMPVPHLDLAAEVKLGERVPFSGSGFTPNGQLKLTIKEPDRVVEHSTTADNRGNIVGTISIPVDRVPGEWILSVRDQKTGRDASTWFNVALPKPERITGNIKEKDDKKKEIRVQQEDGGRSKELKVTDDTILEDENGKGIDFDDLHEGDRVEVEFQGKEATKIKKLPR